MARLTPEMKARCRTLRLTATPAERALWRLVTSSFPQWRFRRQHPFGPYILDVACVQARLALEADGGQHADSGHDRQRDGFLTERGWRVLRLWNREILDAPDQVTEIIAQALIAGK